MREHEDGAVVLASADALRRVRAANLIGASVMNHPTTAEPDRELDAVLISSLTPAQRTKVERQRQVLIELCDADRTADSYEEAAKALGVSVRSTYRLATRYQARGVAGLIDPRLLSQRRAVDPDWDATCVSVLDGFRDASNPTMKTVIAKTHAAFRAAFPERRVPSDSVAYLRVRELDKGRYTFAAAKQRRSVAERPAGVLGRLRADRPGQYVVLDSTPLDVFAMEPITLRWVNVELSVGMDLYSRCITGLTLRPVAAKAPDVAGVLYQTVTPQTWGREQSPQEGPYVGVPDAIVTGETGVLPDTIVVDHGKIYLSEHVLGICVRFGMNVQPAIPHKPTDKPTVERFFRTIRQQLLEHLPAYKGPDVYSRGKDVEQHAFLYVSELEQILREWVGIYHHTPHAGLRDPHLPHVDLSPAQMFARGIAQSGMLRLPASEDLVREFLQVEWRTIQHYGVEIRGQRYDGPGLNTHRGGRSPYGGVHAGKWPFMVDPDDVRWVYFKDPDTSGWHRLEWEHAPGLDAPFSQDAADYTRRLSRQSNRFVDPAQAIADLLADWSTQQVTERRDKNLAIRLSAQRAQTIAGAEPLSGRETASDLGVIDFLARRTGQRPPRDADLTDDLDVFDAYYQAHPEGGLEVYEE
ncbi:MAG: helix-turn-helix domain-containing protein [Microlunatus sp.]|nr:helix-turn-helix domain-containing protein [Microlunatus sp.]